jgi:undecaprenyl-phosphate galactose phosphotransferase
MASKFQMTDSLQRFAIALGGNRGNGPSRTLAEKQLRTGLMLFAADLTALLTAFAITWALHLSLAGASPSSPYRDLAPEDGLFLALIAVAILLYTASIGHYHRRFPSASQQRHLALGGAAAFLLSIGLLSASAGPNASVPNASVLDAGVWILFPAIAIFMREISRRLLDRAKLWRVPTLVIGQSDAALRATDALASTRGLGFDVVSTMQPWVFEANPENFDWEASLRKRRAQFVVLAPASGPISTALTDTLDREQIPFAIIKSSDEDAPARTHAVPLNGNLDLHIPRHSLRRPIIRAVKILLDLTLALALLIFMSPVFLIIAVLVKRDGGPAFYAHRRVGANGQRFGCLKFRSMAVNAEALLDRLLREDPERAAEWDATQKLRDDPRVTKIGAFLRKTSLDEIPQLLNVLRLEMSLVGPRPIVEKEMRHYGREIAFYLQVRPGVTGLWQISGRSDTSYAQRVQLDTTYVRSWSLLGDLVILAKTAPAVLARRGAV